MYHPTAWQKCFPSSYLAEVKTSFKTLVALFGEPYLDRCLDQKSTTEWVIEDHTGRIFTIYDYGITDICWDPERMKVYTDRLRTDVVCTWHIGGSGDAGVTDLITFIRSKS